MSFTPPQERRLQRAAKRINELRAWRNARQHSIPDWSFTAPNGTTSMLQVGDPWPVVNGPVSLSATGNVPGDWSGAPVELELWLGGEALISLSTGLQAGLDPFHHSFPLWEPAKGDETVSIVAEVMPKGMFGSHIAEPRLDRAHLVVPQPDVRALERDLSLILEACEQLGDHEVVPFLIDIVEDAYISLDVTWPTGTDVTVTRLAEGYRDTMGTGIASVSGDAVREARDVEAPWTGLWQVPPAPRDLEPLPDEALQAVRTARTMVNERLEKVREKYPPVGNLVLTGHAHIDLGWLWPVAETRRKARRTFSSVLSLMERYDDFTFSQSSSQLYAWLEEDDPDLLERIKARVAEGRWEPVGGSWAEPDCQVTGGESVVRHLLYGQSYWQQHFGKRASVAWLPDVFGFSAGLPQLLLGAGLTGFFTTKMNWSEENVFPHDLFEWEGLDGSVVTAHSFLNPGLGYNGNIAPLDTLHTWRNFRGKQLHDESLLAFGWGDGGGGPSQKMLENYSRLKEFPALPRLRMGHVDDFYEELPEEGLPRWTGELYMELHRGTLTTQAKVKALNRAAEHRLLEAEAFGAIALLSGFDYPKSEIEAAWKVLLLNQFHDILPGSSINEVYQVTHPELEEVVATARRIRDEALTHLGAGDSGDMTIANAALTPRPLVVTLPAHSKSTVTRAGKTLPSQSTDDGLLVVAPAHEVPALGTLTLTLESGNGAVAMPAAVAVDASSDGAVLENDLLRVEINTDGALQRVYDKVAARETLTEPGNQLWAYIDKPRAWDAWDVDEAYEREGERLTAVDKIEAVERGPLRGAIRVERTWRDSRIVQTYRLLTGSRRLDIVTEIDWHDRAVLLRALFPLAVQAHEATFETMYGAVRRPTHRNTSWDSTRFEVSGHRWVDMSETGYGAALLNDAKYAYSAHRNLLGISLLRSPRYPDLYADEGPHRFTYSLFPHEGDWTTSGVVNEAFAVNSPLIALPAGGSANDAPFLTVTGGLDLTLGSLKPAEDENGLILRLHEPHGARGAAHLTFAHPPSQIETVNLLEEPVDRDGLAANHDGKTLRLEVRPFEVATLRLLF